MHEFDGVHSALIEAPMVSQPGFFQVMLKLATSLMKYVKQLAVIVQPTIRRVVQRTDWIAQWNSEDTPFKFYRCCSCSLPSAESQLTHLTYYLGVTKPFQPPVCREAPHTGQTREFAGRTLAVLCSRLLEHLQCAEMPVPQGLSTEVSSEIVGHNNVCRDQAAADGDGGYRVGRETIAISSSSERKVNQAFNPGSYATTLDAGLASSATLRQPWTFERKPDSPHL